MRCEFLRVESSFYRSAATWRAGYKVMACNEVWESLEFQLSDAFGSLPSLYEVRLHEIDHSGISIVTGNVKILDHANSGCRG